MIKLRGIILFCLRREYENLMFSPVFVDLFSTSICESGTPNSSALFRKTCASGSFHKPVKEKKNVVIHSSYANLWSGGMKTQTSLSQRS